MTICNLYRLDTPASKERHNQPGRVPWEINTERLPDLSPSSLSLCQPPIFFDFIFLLPHTHSISLLSFFFFYTYDSVSGCCPPSGCLDLALLHAVTSYLAYFPLCGERSHLSKNGLQPSSTADWRLPPFIGSQPSFSPLLLP